ncbi:MAG: hypothetical protein ABR540_07295 [Acidimicrobiales bacterium]|nr:hypothetical protein [Actinomycetota bacterium]
MSDSQEPATADSWEHVPTNSPTNVPNPRRTWSDAEWDRIRRGHVPQSPDDPWFAFVEGDRLSIHRRDTGAGIYSVRFRRELSGWRIVSAEVESDPQIHLSGNAAEESRALQTLIESLLLGA